MNRALWIVQGLLAALFLFAGVVKLVLPAERSVSEPRSDSAAPPRPAGAAGT